MLSDKLLPICSTCNEEFLAARFALGYKVCLPCGEAAALAIRKARTKACMPMHKSNYVPVFSVGQALELSQMRKQ
jgi:hypothetical protein